MVEEEMEKEKEQEKDKKNLIYEKYNLKELTHR